jgi:hypothetical protein
MQRFKNGIKRLGKPAVAALLIAVMSFLTIAAPCVPLHQQLHHAGHDACDNCVLCTMIQGHVDCPVPVPVLSEFVPAVLDLTPAADSTAVHQVDLRLSPGRAPPAC